MWRHWMDVRRWLYAPDEGGGGGGTPAPAAPAAPSAPAATSAPAAPAAAPPAAPVSPSQAGPQGTTVSEADLYAQRQAAAAAPGAPAAAPPAQGAPTPGQAPAPSAAPVNVAGVRDYARSLGIDPGQYADDATFLRDLLAAGQQAATFRSQAQQLAQQQAALLQRFSQPQQVPQPQQAPANPLAKFWNPPEYQPAWEGLISRDAQGNVTLRPGAPPDVLPKYLAYHQYRRDFADRLLSDPINTLQPLVNQMADQRAQQLIDRHMGSYRDSTYVEGFIAQNSNWLHARDAAGNLLTNPATGKPMLSPAGQRFTQHVVQAERSGVKDVRQQEYYARRMLQADLLMAGQGQTAAQQAALAAQQQAVAGVNRRPNQSGSVPNLQSPIPPTVAQNPGLSLKEQMEQAMRQAGITDQAVETSMGV